MRQEGKHYYLSQSKSKKDLNPFSYFFFSICRQSRHVKTNSNGQSKFTNVIICSDSHGAIANIKKTKIVDGQTLVDTLVKGMAFQNDSGQVGFFASNL